ncbi:MAG: vitamin K epoxide reductase family protein [Synechococcaceae cyanobacterium]|nr:vitamin K epoxide reductase family protein [Synechococcaceae cyanobacterium]
MTSSRLANRLSSRRRSDPTGGRWIRVAMAVLATIGVIDTGSITLRKWELLGSLTCAKDGFLGCNGCEKVLSSAWGSLFGQPLSLFGFLAYASVLVMAVLPLILQGEARSELARRSWWGLFLVSTGMTVFSGVLVGVMVYGIRDCCPFCILSAVLSLGLLVLSLVGGEWEDRGQLVFRGVILAMVVAIVGLGWAASVNRPQTAQTGSPPPVERISSPAAVALADHLTATGAAMYTAYWCPHCHEQKELFGREASQRLKVIECAPDGRNSQAELCASKRIEGFPTWEIKGKLESGVKPLAKLAAMSDYTGAKDF